MQTLENSEIFRFGDFELDVAEWELRRLGRPVKLGRQAMDVLILLVQRRRQLVPRSDIVDRLWGQDVFVDVETGVNTAISKIRQALRDSAEAPEFVETVPGRGYRFIAAVEVVPHLADGGLPGQPVDDQESTHRAAPLPSAEDGVAMRRGGRFGKASRVRLAIGLALILTATSVVAWTWRGVMAPPSRVTLAVLPFENLGSDPEREYLAAGLTEETNASLAQIDPDRLSVKGRTLRYKGSTKSALEIGQELSVDYLVEGTIRAEGGRLRVTTTLIRVQDQEHVWSQSYEREPTSLLGLQRDLSTDIAEQIRVRLSASHASNIGRRQTQNADAYDAYLKGRFLENRRTPATNARAIEQFERAIALDPDYALAWSRLAFTYAGSVVNSDARPREMAPRAREAAAQAIRTNPNLAEAQFVVGYVHWLLDWQWPAAEAEFRRAIELDPSNAEAHRTLGHALSQMGRHSEAAVEMRRTRELEPLEAMSYALSAQVAFQAREYDSAMDYARRAVLLNSQFWIGYMELGQADERKEDNDVALEAIRDAERFSGGNSKAPSMRGYLLAKTGRTSEAREVLRRLETDSRDRYVPPYAMALVYAGLGDRDAIFEWLDKAYAERDVHLIYLPVDPKWDPYRTDPRFVAVLARCGFASTPVARSQ